MKLVTALFIVGILAGLIVAVVVSRKNSARKQIETFECSYCDENNCECHKKN